MARMYPDDMVALVRKGMGEVSVWEWPDLELLRLLNEARIDICCFFEIPELETSETVNTVANQAQYELTSTDIAFLKTSATNQTRGVRLRLTSRDEQTRTNQTTVAMKGDVLRWLETGLGSNGRKQVEYWMTPTGVMDIQHWYQRIVPEIELSPAPVPFEWPEQWDLVAVREAVEKGLGFDQDRGEAVAEKEVASGRVVRAARTVQGPSRRVWRPGSSVAGAVRRR